MALLKLRLSAFPKVPTINRRINESIPAAFCLAPYLYSGNSENIFCKRQENYAACATIYTYICCTRARYICIYIMRILICITSPQQTDEGRLSLSKPRINPIVLTYFQPLRNRSGCNVVRWCDACLTNGLPDPDGTILLSHLHERAILQTIRSLIGTAEPAPSVLLLSPSALLAKQRDAENQMCLDLQM